MSFYQNPRRRFGHYLRNPDEELRRLERELHTDPNAETFARWSQVLFRSGMLDAFLASLDTRAQYDVDRLQEALLPGNYVCRSPEIYSKAPLLCPEPPPASRTLNLISGQSDTAETYISEEGDFGTTYSELAMHVGLSSSQAERYILVSQDPPHVSWAYVEFFNRDRRVVADGLPSEVLPLDVRREIDGHGGITDPMMPLPGPDHQPMVPYEVTLVGRGDGIYRAKVAIFYYPQATYWRLSADNWDYRSLEPVIKSAWPSYIESYEP